MGLLQDRDITVIIPANFFQSIAIPLSESQILIEDIFFQ